MSSFASDRTSRPFRHLVAALSVLALVAAPSEAAKKKKKPELDPEDGIITGIVKDVQGKILPGTDVTISALDPTGFQTQVRTDKDGEFEVVIPEASGEYLVILAKSGYATFEAPITLGPGEQQNIDFKLVDEATGRRQDAIDAYNAGANAFNATDLATAKEKFLAAVDLDDALPQPHLALADLYMTEGDYQQAAEHAEHYLALQPGEQKALVIAHEAYRKLGNKAKVDEYRTQLGDSDVSDTLAVQVFNEGAMASQSGDWDGATAKFLEALELDPGLTQAMEALAQIYYSQSATDKALAMADQLLAADPSNARGRRYRFLVLEATGGEGVDEALAAYAEVDAANAAEALYELADLDFRGGELELAKRKLHKAIELAPEHARAHYKLGLVYAGSDTAKAKEYLQKFLALAPDDPEAETAKEMIAYF